MNLKEVPKKSSKNNRVRHNFNVHYEMTSTMTMNDDPNINSIRWISILFPLTC